MSEMRRMTEEIRLRDERKDEDIRRLIADCQRKDEIIFSLIAAIKEQMASPLSMTSEGGFPDSSKERSKDDIDIKSSAQMPSDIMTSERLVKTDKLQKIKSTLLATDMLTGAAIEQVASKGQPAVVNQEAKSQVSTDHDFMLGAIGSAKTSVNTSDVCMEDKHSTSATSNLKNSSTEHTSAISQSQNKEIAIQQGTSNSGVKMKPATFDGSTSWIVYKTHIDMCNELNKWDARQKGLYLAVSLRGHAQDVLGNLPVEERSTFEKLSKTLAERFHQIVKLSYIEHS